MFALAPFALPADYGEGIVPLADVKAYLSIETDEDAFDDLLGFLRDSAVDMVERYCGVYLAVREGVVWAADRLPRPLRLGVRPVTAIESFAYLDGANAGQTIDIATLRLGLHGEVVPVPGAAWPSDIAAGLTVTFTAGYDDETRPPALVAAVLRFTAHLFRFRDEAGETGVIAGDIPASVKQACASYRLPVI